ncbi:MAG: hypothetical protein FH762_19875 [Firmicutes bacterium]|nr:hypothetical protein [Bacillota bacterium]
MVKQTILYGALANTTINNSSEELLNFIKENMSDIEVYRRKLKPGEIYNAALDWHVILGDISAIITIAGLLWKAYKKFIIPDEKDNAFLFVQVKNGNKSVHFNIGKEYKDKEIFIETFKKKVTIISSGEGNKREESFDGVSISIKDIND